MRLTDVPEAIRRLKLIVDIAKVENKNLQTLHKSGRLDHFLPYMISKETTM